MQAIFMLISCLRYHMKRIALFIFFFSFLVVNLSFSQIQPDTTFALQNIEIQGHYMRGVTGLNMKRLNSDYDLTSFTTTAADAFRRLPSIVSDIEGNIIYRGSNRSSLLINSIPYGLTEEYSGDMLIQLPAMFFDHVDISSVPLIELVPDGDAGIINLFPRKFNAFHSPLQLNVGVGLNDRYNAGFVMNVNPGRFHITAKYNYRKEYRTRDFSKTTVTPTGTTIMDNNATARPDVHVADLDIGYDLSSKDLLSVYGLYQLMDYSRYGAIHITKENVAGKVLNEMLRHRYNDQRQEAYAAEARWGHTFAKPQDQLSVVFNYNNFSYDEGNDYKNEKYGTGVILAQNTLDINHKKDNFYFSTVLRRQLESNVYMHVGLIERYKKENYKADATKLANGSWLNDATQTNDFSYDRWIHLLLVSFEKDWNDLSATIGAQGEISSGFHLYPHFQLTYGMSDRRQLLLSYSQRVVRPFLIDLNPFFDQSDATHLKVGNPDLKNEYIHSTEMSYRFINPRFAIIPTLYYRYIDNRILEVASQVEKQTVWEKNNVGNSQTYGFELSTNWQPFRFMEIGWSGNIFHDEIDGRVIGYDEKKSLICGDTKANVNISITPTTKIQFDGFIISNQLTAQGKIKSRGSVNVGLSQYFMKQKLRLNLSVNNIFDTLKETTTVNSPNLTIKQIRNRDARVAWLMCSYYL